MKSKPMLFSAPMVRALLEGRKTQTRRIMKLQPISNGDEIWVRESYYQRGHWEQISGLKARSRTGRQRWKFVPADDVVVFDAPDVFRKGRHAKDPAAIAWHKRLGRFMPRWASRITLKVIDVRVQRLQDISEEDARAEGVIPGERSPSLLPHQRAYRTLWNEINGPGSWDANPFVWAYTFEVKR